MRIDSAILSNAIITASVENPIVSGSSQVNITNTTGYSTFSSSIKTYADAKVAGIVNSAPATLDTLDELAAALGDDANISASFATTLGTKLPTATHTAFSSSNASALRTEYSGADTTLSASAHTQRAAIDAKISALDSTYATDASVSSLSASAHTRREEISASLDATIDALDSLGISTDTERGALSSSAHTQRVALNSAQTTANNTLSSSIATALRAEITSGDAAFLTSASIGATINDNAVKLSGIEAGATADQSDSEIKTAYENNSDTNAFTDALLSKLNAIEASADVTDATNVTAAGALMDSEVTNLAQVKAFDSSDYIASASNGAKLNAIEAGADVTDATNVAAAGALMSSSLGGQINDDTVKLSGIEAGADVTDTANVTAAGALMDSELTDLAGVKGVTISTLQVKPSEGAFANGDKTKLDGIETGADVTDATNVTAAGALMDSEVTNLAAVKALNQGLTTTSDVTFADLLVTGDLTVQGTRTELQVATLNVEDLNITVASGSADSAAADGAGLTIAGADESITWDHGNSRFNFSDDVHVVGNITVSGNVDGRDVATDGSKLDGIESGATADQTAAEIRTLVDNASDSNVFTDADHTKLNGIEASADVTDTTNVVAALTAGSNITISAGGEISSTDTNTTYSVGDGGLTQNNFTNALKTKLDGIEASADVTDTTNVVAALTAGTNITISAGGEISSTDTNTTYSVGDGGLTENNFTDALKTKLDGIEASADVTDTTNVVAALTAGTNISIAGDGTISSTDTNTTYSVGDGGLTAVNFTTARRDKLDGIATSANNYAISNDNGSNVHFEGLMIGQTTGATANTIRCVGDIVAYYSDDRLKNKIGNLEDALSKVNSLNGFTYTPNEAALALGVDQDEVRVGVSAQEVQAVLPEAVKDAPVENTEGYLTVQYEKVVPLLIEAIKELSAKVEELSK